MPSSRPPPEQAEAAAALGAGPGLRDEMLREAYATLRRHLESTPLALIEWDGDYRVVGYSRRAQEMLGYAPEEVLGKRIDEIPWVPEEDWPAVRAVMRDMRTSARPANVNANRNRRKDGTLIDCEWYNSALHDASGKLVSVLSLVLDVTDRARLIAQLEDAQARAASVARFPRENPDPVLRIARDSSVLYANEAAERLLGAEQGRPAPRQIAEAAGRASTRGQRLKEELAFEGAVYLASLVPVGDEVNVYAQDMTPRKMAEEALRAANERLRESDRRKDEFLAMLSHELRNPLAPIRNALHLLEASVPDDAPGGRARVILRRQTDHLTRLIDDLLDVTRISRGKIQLRVEPIDLRDVVRRTVDDLRPLFDASGVALDAEVPSGPVRVDADPTRMAQVLGNLLQNAAKFTPRDRGVHVTVSAEGGRATLSVRDDGVGMDPADVKAMFEPFVQAERGLARTRGGLGLGLALVKGLVELHGGTVQGRSEGTGRGSEFVVTLPLASGAPPARAAPAPRPVAPAGRLVLLIEDNEDAARTLADVLELQGHRVLVAADGATGIALAREARPDVVLCDIGLPDMDGFEVARTLRRDPVLRQTRLVALSGYALPEDRERSRAAGFDAHVAKPAPVEEIAGLLG